MKKKSVVESAWDTYFRSTPRFSYVTEEELREQGWMRLSAYASRLGVSPTTAHRRLKKDEAMQSEVFTVLLEGAPIPSKSTFVRPKSLAKALEKSDSVRIKHTTACEL